MFAEIILPLHLKGTFTYKIPENLISNLQLGMRVLVPFGGKKIYTGIVIRTLENEPKNFKAKEIISILDDFSILPSEQILFWEWLADYYLCNLGDIYRYAFPSSLKLESETFVKIKPNAAINFEILEANEMYLIQALEVRQIVNISEIEAFIPKKEIIKTINSLIDLQYIEIDEFVGEKYKPKEVAYIRIKNIEEISKKIPEILQTLKKSPKQQELFLMVLQKQTENPDEPIRKSSIFDEGKFAYTQLKTLIEKNLIEEYIIQKDRISFYEGELEELPALSMAQKSAKLEIDKAFLEGKNVLLHGVTSSGKTHIYLEKIEETIQEGKMVLFLLPEISITKQIISRLEKNYGKELGFYHNKLTDFEKVELWKKILKNEIKIIIGTKNSLFLPFPNLGLIVVDEEHDTAYKQKEITPFFNAKDCSLVLAKFYNAKLILGSATPSLESYYLAQKGKLKYISLQERYRNVSLPIYEIQDYKEAQDSKKTVGNFTQYTLKEIQSQLDAKKQIIILHNRRGYAKVLECESCGYAAFCSNCDVVMAYHKYNNELKCHYCGHKAVKPQICPKCQSEKLNTRGIGVEKIYEEVQKLFPDAEVDRMDVDAMRRKFAYEKLYEKIENQETDIIVGTQMISKGLDFDNIELVVIPRADQMLQVQDFRAEERAYQLITQISGRAGRVSGKGKIIIQAFNPNHSVFKLIKENAVSKIYQYLLTERKKYNYPPFTKTILIEIKHRKEDKCERASLYMASILRKYLPAFCVLGPEKSPIGKINLLYQYQILLKLPRGKKYNEFKNFIHQSIQEFDEISAYNSIKKHIFVDF